MSTQQKKRGLLITTSVVLIIGLLSVSQGLFAQTIVEVTDMLWIPARIQGFQEGIKDFETKYPDIKVKYTPISWDTYRSWLVTSFAGGEMPDVCLTESETTRDLAAMGATLNLSKVGYWNKNIADKFLPLAVEAGQYKGDQYGYPKTVTGNVGFYRKEFFREAGINELPKNWDEFVEVAKKLTKDIDGDGKTDRWGFELTLTGDDVSLWWVLFQYQSGCDVMKEIAPDEYQMCINNSQSWRGSQFMIDLMHKHKVMSPSCIGMSFADIHARGYEGKWAITYQGTWVLGWLSDKWPEGTLDRFEYGLIPAGPAQSASMVDSQSYNISANSKHKEEALKFVQYFTSPDYVLLKECFPVGCLPARIDCWDDPRFETVPKEYLRQALKVAKEDLLKNGRVYPMVPQFGEIQKDFIIPAVEIMLALKKPIKEMHDFLQIQGNRVLTR